MHTTAQPQLGSCAHTASNCGRVASGCVQQGGGHAHTQTKTTTTGNTQHDRPAQKPKLRPRETARPAARRPPLPTTTLARPRLEPTLETHTADPRPAQVPVPPKTPIEPQINLRLVFQFQTRFLNLRFVFESQIRSLNLRFTV